MIVTYFLGFHIFESPQKDPFLWTTGNNSKFQMESTKVVPCSASFSLQFVGQCYIETEEEMEMFVSKNSRML